MLINIDTTLRELKNEVFNIKSGLIKVLHLISLNFY